jgi:hypothetical protein
MNKKYFFGLFYLILNSRQSRLKREDKTKPMLRAMPTTKKYYCLEEKMTQKNDQVEKMQLKLDI